MGNHLVDPTSPEFNGRNFTKTLIWGSCEGQIHFIEPMVTKAYLQSRPNVTEPIKQPKKYATAGYYPTSYRVAHSADAQAFDVALEGLVLR
jgi:hypothetical protein